MCVGAKVRNTLRSVINHIYQRPGRQWHFSNFVMNVTIQFENPVSLFPIKLTRVSSVLTLKKLFVTLHILIISPTTSFVTTGI